MKPQDTATVAQLGDYEHIIDVRSPSEFLEDHVPGAISAPVLDDEERARIGTLYKQVSPFDAKKAGAALVSRNIARHLETLFADRGRDWRPLVYCWRGGKRSGAMAHILREIGWRAVRLEGGYKAYRHEVLQQLAALPATLKFRVVCGETGSAKSRLLEALAAQGAQVLDLEQLASHKGSVLGALPGNPQPAQRMFDSLLWDRLRRLDAATPVFVEAESKKIGQIHLPDELIAAMRGSDCVRIEAPLDERVRFLLRDYAYFIADPSRLGPQLDCLVGLHGAEVIESWKAAMARGDWPGLVADLLERHYDPAYRKSTNRNYLLYAAATVVQPRNLEPAGLAEAAAGLLAA